MDVKDFSTGLEETLLLAGICEALPLAHSCRMPGISVVQGSADTSKVSVCQYSSWLWDDPVIVLKGNFFTLYFHNILCTQRPCAAVQNVSTFPTGLSLCSGKSEQIPLILRKVLPWLNPVTCGVQNRERLACDNRTTHA